MGFDLIFDTLRIEDLLEEMAEAIEFLEQKRSNTPSALTYNHRSISARMGAIEDYAIGRTANSRNNGWY